MQPDRFTKSSHERTLFDAWFGTLFAVLFGSFFWISAHESGNLVWLLRGSPVLIVVGFWLKYFTTKRWPDVWEIVVDRHSICYFRNGELTDKVRRTETVGIHCYTSWMAIENVQSIKLELRNGGSHNVSEFRLNHEDQSRFVDSVERQWDLTATNDKASV